MKKKLNINNCPDQKIDGKWIRSWGETTDEFYICNHTRAGCLWTSINKRCGLDREIRYDYSAYKDSSNKFPDFQEFTEWCQSEHGYLNKEASGRFWSLDKDFIEYGNKIYCADKCLFVPHKINAILIGRKSDRGEFPLGVSRKKIAADMVNYLTKSYQANCCDGTGRYRGIFADPFEAHRAWQLAKVDQLRNAMSDELVRGHTRLINALEYNAERILSDYQNNRETFAA